MNSYKIKYSKEFKKSLKKIIKQGKDINKLLKVVDMLSNKQPLDFKYKDHALYNDKRFKNCRDCHIEPDWILIYSKIDDNEIKILELIKRPDGVYVIPITALKN